MYFDHYVCLLYIYSYLFYCFMSENSSLELMFMFIQPTYTAVPKDASRRQRYSEAWLYIIRTKTSSNITKILKYSYKPESQCF